MFNKITYLLTIYAVCPPASGTGPCIRY